MNPSCPAQLPCCRRREGAWIRTPALVAILAAFAALEGAAPVECRGESDGRPQFLGPHRNGISTETGLLEAWPQSGPKILWRVPGGAGMSGLAVRDRRLVTLVQREGKQWLVAHDARK